MIDTVRRLYLRFADTVSYLQSPFLLFVRMYWGWQFLQAGWGKFHDIQKVVSFFTDLGIPMPGVNAWVVATVECVGGILLFLGVGSRLISLVLTFNMLVAFVTADREAFKSFFSDPDKFTAAAPYTFLFAVLLILIFGPGKFAVDELLRRRFAPADARAASR
jgi:putative oxidoreductase